MSKPSFDLEDRAGRRLAQDQRSKVQRNPAHQLYLAREHVVLDTAESFIKA
jgi:hypothetical protein